MHSASRISFGAQGEMIGVRDGQAPPHGPQFAVAFRVAGIARSVVLRTRFQASRAALFAPFQAGFDLPCRVFQSRSGLWLVCLPLYP